jgi:hypothetical protein
VRVGLTGKSLCRDGHLHIPVIVIGDSSRR